MAGMRWLPTAPGAGLLLVLLAPSALSDDAATRVARAQADEHRHHAPADDPDSPAGRLDAPAPDWSFTRWIGPALTLADLRGRVVLVRWWTEGCRFCRATLPELERLRLRHEQDGLVVIGAFHPKPPREVGDRHITSLARKLGFHGRIAVDRDWATLDRYWLDGHPGRNWTSVSFLIDRAGIVRWVHPGGEYHRSDDPAHARCGRQLEELERMLGVTLAEPAPSPPAP